jgi:hypothetical protein
MQGDANKSPQLEKVYNICKLCKAIFSAFYNISQPNLLILVILYMLFLTVVIYLHLLA